MDKVKHKSSLVLMVIIPDILSDIINKGEVINRYYNPGNFFGEVHIVLTNNDKPDINVVQKMVGTAKLYIHNLTDDKIVFFLSLGWESQLLKFWVRGALRLVRNIQPQIIRCHGASVNIFIAAYIKQKFNIPYVASMHTNPDEYVHGVCHDRVGNFIRRFVANARKKIARIGLMNADLVMPVYSPIVPYLKNLGVVNYEICYNVINPEYIRVKDNYSLGNTVKIISVGRQFLEKNPDNLIRAVAQIKNIELTVVGDGPYHQHLINVVDECNIQDRVVFHKSIPNDQLCGILPSFDIFATHTECWEISKSVLEPLLTGLPVLLNKRKGLPVEELTNDICILVPNTVEGYRDALVKLINDQDYREDLGKLAYAHSQANWSPKITEEKFVKIYKKIVEGL
jgi:glycosyltransferase involved in cell wall biosynthesis